MPFSVLIHPVIHYRSPRKKLKQETNTIFRGALTTQATSKYSSLREKYSNTEFFSGPYFPVFGLITEIYEVNHQKQTQKCQLELKMLR